MYFKGSSCFSVTKLLLEETYFVSKILPENSINICIQQEWNHNKIKYQQFLYQMFPVVSQETFDTNER